MQENWPRGAFAPMKPGWVLLRILVLITASELAATALRRLLGLSHLEFADVFLLPALATPFLYVWVVRPVAGGERLEAEIKLAESEERFRSLFEYNRDAVFALDMAGRFTALNPVCERVGGYRNGEVLGREFDDLVSKKDRGKSREYFQRVLANQKDLPDLEVEIVRGDDTAAFLRVLGVPIVSQGEVTGAFAIAQDITAWLQGEEKMRLAAKVIETISEAVAITDAEGIVQSVNPAFSAITGYGAGESIGKNPRFLHSGRQESEFYRDMWDVLRCNGQWEGEIWNRRKSGELYLELTSINALKNEMGETTNYVSVSSDITERKHSEERLAYLASHDVLTGLPNRILFTDRLKQAILQAKGRKEMVGVLFLDLDRFKNVNDTLGHAVGDRLLQVLSRRLTESTHEEDTVTRIGGDEFAVILKGISDAKGAAVCAKRLLEVLGGPCQVEEHELFINASCGISLFPLDGKDPDTLLRYADAAMYYAKEQGRNNYQFYRNDLNSAIMERLNLESALRRGLERDEFTVYYQPQVEVTTRRIIGVEALVRWRHPDLGVVAPDRFIPLAEETGLILPLGDWIMGQACTQAVAWREAGLPPITMAVNLSGRQFNQGEVLVEKVHRVLEETGMDPFQLELEITESFLMQNPEVAAKTMAKLRSMGIRFAVDDFGTGYSSLSYLKRFPLDRLKVAQVFVRDIIKDPNDAIIASAVIALAHSLKLRTIAEGVENAEQLGFLTSRGCDEIQGYFFSRPVPPEEVEKLLQEGILPGNNILRKEESKLT